MLYISTSHVMCFRHSQSQGKRHYADIALNGLLPYPDTLKSDTTNEQVGVMATGKTSASRKDDLFAGIKKLLSLKATEK